MCRESVIFESAEIRKPLIYMKLSICCWVAVTLCTTAIYAQKSPIKFGDIPLEDLKMTTYAPDSSAAAVILCDYGEAYLSLSVAGAKLNFERHVRIKILKKEGLDQANASILLYHDGSTEEKVTGLKAVTYNLEGGKVVETKMSKDGIFKEKYDRDFNVQKFTLPNVKVGSVFEYSYTIPSDFFTNFPNWKFQYEIPVRHSEYWAMIPEYFFYEKYMQGYLSCFYEMKPKSQADFQVTAHHWVLDNAPAFKEEPYMTNEDDYVSRINFALSHIQLPQQPVREIMGSWKKLNDDLLESESFGKLIKTSGFLKRQVDEVTAGITEPEKKMAAIYSYVKENIEWNGVRDLLADPPRKVFDQKKGTSSDINIILASMLEKADIPVEMVLLSTRDHGFVRREYPMRRQFNYSVCRAKLGDKYIFLDATERLLPMGVLPDRCLNGEGLVISATAHGWVKLESKAKARTVVSGDFILKDDGELKGKLKFTRDGYDAFKMRKTYQTKGEQQYLKDILGEKVWQVEKTEFQKVSDVAQAVEEIHEVTIGSHASVAGDVIYINPFVTQRMEENPFRSEKREYPVDFGSAVEETYLMKLTLPAGYAVDEMPKTKLIALPGNAGKFTYSCAQTGESLTVVSSLLINKNLFTQEEYPHLREFYDQVVAKQAEQIVLKKK
jgi:transglutaminase-like putative cysteine protease